MSRIRLLLLASATLISSGALAADLPSTKMPPMAPIDPALLWTGFYIGVQGGYGWGSEHDNLNSVVNANANANAPLDAFGIGGGTGGIHIGYDRQFNNYVLGVVGDANFGNFNTSKTATSSTLSNEGLAVTNLSIRSGWQTSVRARFGYAFDRILVYGTAGVAVAQDQETVSFLLPHFPTHESASGSGGRALVGWTAGGGIAYAIDNHWRVFTEVRYEDFGKGSYPITFSFNPTHQVSYSAGFDETLATGGLSYKF